jgi:ubiquitin C-terminal hydrolase
MFGLQNHRGSCWINAALQSFFRLPAIKQRYSTDTTLQPNTMDFWLSSIWRSKGTVGLREFFDFARTDDMPAGLGIGDSHELFQHMCDKLPFLDELFRFKIAHTIECKHCQKKTTTQDSVIEFSLDSVEGQHVPLSKCIAKTVEPYNIQEWKCDSCNKKGGVRQQLIGSFPACMMFHAPLANTTIDYSSLLVLNGKKYALSSVVCYNGSHWWTFGRDMPPGSSWYVFDDLNVQEHGAKQFPVSNSMRMLIYCRVEE